MSTLGPDIPFPLTFQTFRSSSLYAAIYNATRGKGYQRDRSIYFEVICTPLPQFFDHSEFKDLFSYLFWRMYKSGFSNRFNITFIIILSFVTRVGHSQRFSRYVIIIIIKCVHAHVYIPCYIDTGGEGSYLNFCMELPRELFHSKHFSNGIRWPIFLILSTRVRYKKKNTLISDREKQTIFRRFSTTIPFFFFLRKGKISKNSRNKRYRFSSPPLPVRQNRECVYFALTLHFSLSLFFFSSRIERHEPPYFPDDIYSIRDGRKG